MRSAPFVLVALIGILLGLWHAQLAMQAVFVFKQDEPLTSWLSIALGPASTLIASVIAIFFKRTGGIWLIASGLVSSVVFVIGEHGLSEHVGGFLLQIALPMIAVGAGFLLASRFAKRPSTT